VRNIAIRVGLFAAVGIGAFVLRPFLTGGAGDLKVGECFDVPTAGQTVEEVQHHPCAEAHGGEVIFVGKVGAPAGAPFPIASALDQQVGPLCMPAFDAYTGLTFETDKTWDMGYFYPLEADWAKGDREVICYATRIDSAPTTGSIKKS